MYIYMYIYIYIYIYIYRNVRPYYPHWQYTDLFIFRFVLIRNEINYKIEIYVEKQHTVFKKQLSINNFLDIN